MSLDTRGDPSPADRLPLDLLVVTFVSLATLVLAAFWTGGGVVRTGFGVVFVVFCPGYALVSVLFPGRTSHVPNRLSSIRERRMSPVVISGLERVVASIAASVVLVPLVGFFAHYTRWGVRPTAMLLAVAGLTVALSAVAAVRRLRLLPDDRFGVASLALPQRLAAWVREPDRPAQTALNVFLVVGLVGAIAGIGLAAATATSGERYTEFYLLGDDPDTGNGVADEYPERLTIDGGAEVRVGIENREADAQSYTVVAQLQRLDDDGERIVERVEIDRFTARLEPGESIEQRRAIAPEMDGEELRLVYLLYIDAPPTDPNAENAYRSVHVWVDGAETDAAGE